MFSFKEIAGHSYERHTFPVGKPYVKLIKEDFKIIGKKAREEINKAYTKGFNPDYILDKDLKQPKFELGKDGILKFIPEK